DWSCRFAAACSLDLAPRTQGPEAGAVDSRRRGPARQDGVLPPLIVDEVGAIDLQPGASVDLVDGRLDRVRQRRVAPRAEQDAGNAAEVDGEALEVDRVGALVDDTEFLLVAKRMALDEGQSVGSGRTFADLVQLAVLDVAEAQVGVGRKAGAQLLLVEFDADAVQSLRKDLPVVIGLAGPG